MQMRFDNKANSPVSNYQPALIAFAAIFFLLKLSVVLLTMGKGFDLTDEGYHLLHYKYPEKYPINFHNYHYLVAALPSSWITVMNLRILWVAAELLSASIFMAGFFCFYRKILNSDRKLLLLFFLFCCNGLFISVHDRILAYNSLSNFFIYSAVGLFLTGMSVAAQNRIWNSLYFISGVLLSFQFFVKSSAAFAAIIMLLILLFVLKREIFIRSSLLLVSGVITGTLIFIASFLPPVEPWWSNYQQGLQLAQAAGYGSKLMLVQVYLFQTVYFAVCIALANIPVFFALKTIPGKYKLSGRAIKYLFIGGHVVSSALLFILFLLTSGREYNFELYEFTSSARYHPVMMVVNTLFYVWIAGKINALRSEENAAPGDKIIAAFICIIPFTILFGAFSSIEMSLYGHLVPLLAVLFVLPHLFLRKQVADSAVLYFSFVFTLLCSGFFLHNYALHPARLIAPLTRQCINIGNEENIEADSATAAFITDLRSKTAPYSGIKSILHIGNQPGMVYLLNRSMPGTNLYLSVPYFPEVEDMNLKYNHFFLTHYKEEIGHSLLLINAGVHPLNLNGVDGLGVLDANTHILIDSVYNPYLEKEKIVNKLIQRPLTYIYIPHNRKE